MSKIYTYDELEKLHKALRDARFSLQQADWYCSGITADTSTGGANLDEALTFAQTLEIDAFAIVAAIRELTCAEVSGLRVGSLV